jgi:hypothetical protein
MDLVGGNFFPGDNKHVYALGTEYSPNLRDVMQGADLDLEITYAPIHFLEEAGFRSDYRTFRDQRIPFAFVTTGLPWYYHQPEDDVDRLDFPKMRQVSLWVSEIVRRLAKQPSVPRYVEPSRDPSEAARVLKGQCLRILGSSAVRKTEGQKEQLERMISILDSAMGKDNKVNVHAVMREGMRLVLSLAASQKPN